MQAPASGEPRDSRRRRLRDAARALPWLALVAFFLPVLWSGSEPAASPSGGASTATLGIYLFAAWGLLVFLAALLSRPLKREQARRMASSPRPYLAPEVAAPDSAPPELGPPQP